MLRIGASSEKSQNHRNHSSDNGFAIVLGAVKDAGKSTSSATLSMSSRVSSASRIPSVHGSYREDSWESRAILASDSCGLRNGPIDYPTEVGVPIVDLSLRLGYGFRHGRHKAPSFLCCLMQVAGGEILASLG